MAPVEQYQPFMDAVLKYARFKDVRNVGTALSLLAEIALREAETADETTETDDETAETD